MQPSLFSVTPTLTVGELMRHLKHILDVDDIAQDLWVRGEISNFTRASSGHLYFSLKDGEGAVKCVMWKGQAIGLTRLPAEGDAVRAHGRVSLYEVRGDLQLYVDELAFDGVGALWKKFEQLKAQLQREGLFDRKRPLPTQPRCIGIVTSEQGAALQDMLRILTERWPLVEVVLCPCQVQGIEAPAQIVGAIRTLNRQRAVETIIVARGGGSIEDLWAFNDEAVARAIFASRQPVIAGVGHETDFTIADFVADVRAPTPTAAAALAVPDRADVVRALRQQQSRLWLALDSQLTARANQLNHARRTLSRLAPRARIDRQRQQVDDALLTMNRAMQHQLQVRRERLQSKQLQLAALNPLAILARGYAIVRKDGHPVSAVGQVASGDVIRVRVRDGEFGATVEKRSNV
ncbi:MAG: exodeoxyribonuclease VII large subunit [Chloroflexota bacterium]